MREIRTEEITRAVKEALLRVNYQMGADVMGALRECREKDRSPLSREVLGHIIQNNEIAAKEQVAICQDTGMAIVFAEVGQEVHIVGGGFRDAGRSWWRYASEARWTRRRSWQSWRPTLRPIGSQNADKQYQRLERMALERLNGLGIGAGELGGNTTALAMNIKWYPTHIAGMPVAVNVCCHVAHHCIAPLRDQVSGSACVFCVP